MEIKCSSCNKILRIDENKYNQVSILVQCPRCGQRIRVPSSTKKQIVQATTKPESNPVEEIFSINGRIRRSTFWTRYIVASAIIILVGLMSTTNTLPEILILYIILIVEIFVIIQCVKRMHDVGKSGWFIIIPIYSLVLAFFKDGTVGNNKYGENPKEKNLQKRVLLNSIMILLFSAFISCGLYALMTITKIINDEIVKSSIIVILFTVCNIIGLSLKEQTKIVNEDRTKIT